MLMRAVILFITIGVPVIGIGLSMYFNDGTYVAAALIAALAFLLAG